MAAGRKIEDGLGEREEGLRAGRVVRQADRRTGGSVGVQQLAEGLKRKKEKKINEL